LELVTGNFAPGCRWRLGSRTTWSKTFRNWHLGVESVIFLWHRPGRHSLCPSASPVGGTADLATASGDWVEVANKIIGLTRRNVITISDLAFLAFFLPFFVA